MRIQDQILDELKKARSAPRVARAAGAEIAARRTQRGRSLCQQAQAAYALAGRAAKRNTR